MSLTIIVDGRELPSATITVTNDPGPGSFSLGFDPDVRVGQIMTIGAQGAGYVRYRVTSVETIDYPEPRWVYDETGEGSWVSGYQKAIAEPI